MFISTQEFGSRTFTHDDPRLFRYGGDKLDPNHITLQTAVLERPAKRSCLDESLMTRQHLLLKNVFCHLEITP